MIRAPMRQALRERFDDRYLSQHADLAGIDAHVRPQRIELRGHEWRRHRHDAGDSASVLRGERGDDRAGVAAERADRLDVGKDAGTSRWVDTRDRCDIRNDCSHFMLRETCRLDTSAPRLLYLLT